MNTKAILPAVGGGGYSILICTQKAFAVLVLVTLDFCGCSLFKKETKQEQKDTYVVLSHVVEGEHYVIRHGKTEIYASCQYSTSNPKGDTTRTTPAYCEGEPLPVGEPLTMRRGDNGWLFCDWQDRNVDWHMGLQVQKEEVWKRKGD